MHDTLIPVVSAGVPVTIRELVEAAGKHKTTWCRRAEREGWPTPEGKHAFHLNDLPADLRKKILAHRQRQAAKIAERLVTPTPEWRQFPIALSEFTDDERREGEQRRDFLNEVEELHLTGLPYEPSCDKINFRERNAAHRHDGSLRYKELFIGGHLHESQLTYRNFMAWKALWNPWRDGPFDTTNWHALCPRDRFKAIRDERGRILHFVTRKLAPSGEAKFWALFAQHYEKTLQRSRIKSWEMARDGCLQSGVPAGQIPTLRMVGYHYRQRVNPQLLERAREGEKRHYDVLTIPVMRNHRKTRPNLCWSGDHHVFNDWIKVYDEYLDAWRGVRPWITDWLDIASWKTVGYHISTAPSRDTIELALRKAIEWTGGVPKHLYFDNGKDYQAFSSGGRFQASAAAKSFTDGGRLGYDAETAANVCAALGIHPIFALPHNPRAKLNERNYRIMERFEQNVYSYHGRNEAHQKILWDLKREDGFTLRHRLEKYPKKHKLAGCLLHPELLPDLKTFRALFAEWLQNERHQMVSKGRVNPGKSPQERYATASEPKLLRPVISVEIALAFLRVHRQLILVKRNGTFLWTPPGGTANDQLCFADDALRPFAGEKVQVRFDNLNVFPPAVFAFHQHEYEDHGEARTTWKLIECHGPEGSVPNTLQPDAIVEGDDASQVLRDQLADNRRVDRDSKRAADHEAEKLARQQLDPLNGRTAAPYILTPRAVTEKIAANLAEKSTLRDAFKDVPETELDTLLNGPAPEGQ